MKSWNPRMVRVILPLSFFITSVIVNLFLQLSHHPFANRCLVLKGNKFSHLSASEPSGYSELFQQHPCAFSSPSTLAFDTLPAVFALPKKPHSLVSDNFGATHSVLIAVSTFQLTSGSPLSADKTYIDAKSLRTALEVWLKDHED